MLSKFSGGLQVTYMHHFYYTLKNTEFSNSPSNWGVLGDYLNPFIALANLIVLIFLTIEIKRIENKREEENSKLEQKRDMERREIEDERLEKTMEVHRRVTLSQMRNEEAKHIIKILDSYFSGTRVDSDFYDKLLFKTNQIESEFYSFVTNNDYLFTKLFSDPEFKLLIQNIKDTLAKTRTNTELILNYREQIERDNREYKLIEESIRNYTHKENDKNYNELTKQEERMEEERQFISKAMKELGVVDRVLPIEFDKLYVSFVRGINDFIVNELGSTK